MHGGCLKSDNAKEEIGVLPSVSTSLEDRVGETSYKVEACNLGHCLVGIPPFRQIGLPFREVRCERDYSLRRTREPPAGRADMIISLH